MSKMETAHQEACTASVLWGLGNVILHVGAHYLPHAILHPLIVTVMRSIVWKGTVVAKSGSATGLIMD